MAIRQRNDPVRLFGRRVVLALVVALVVFAGFSLWSAYEKERESAALRIEAEIQLADLATRRQQLDKDIASLQSQRGMEELLREQYSLAREGEGLIVIVEPQAATVTEATSTMMQKIRGVFGW